MTVPRHPAKFDEGVLTLIRAAIYREFASGDLDRPTNVVVLDPFAGVGGIHKLRDYDDDYITYDTVGIELEPEWAKASEHTWVGSALDIDFDDGMVDVIATSPCYGNRMADHHEAKDDTKRNTYRHALGRPLTDGSAAAMQWGTEYCIFHTKAWMEADRVLKPGGLFILNISNHIRGGKEVPVAPWHATVLLNHIGLVTEDVRYLRTPRLRHGANFDKRCTGEYVYVFRKLARD